MLNPRNEISVFHYNFMALFVGHGPSQFSRMVDRTQIVIKGETFLSIL